MSSPAVAFFGATGGVANAILIHTLQAGYKAVALVRTPQKLRDQLLRQDVSTDVLANLTTIEGNALDVAIVKRTLTAASPTSLPSVIVTGLGGTPVLTFNIWRPLQIATLDNPTITETAAATLLTALRELYAENPSLKSQKPLLTFISTVGISRGPEDVPFWIRYLTRQLLTIPHNDKRKMEDLFRGDQEQNNEEDRMFRGIVGVRPTFLTPLDNSPSDYRDVLGIEKVRAGKEDHPAVGWSVKRGDVGLWVFERVVKQAVEGKKGEWEREMVSLTS